MHSSIELKRSEISRICRLHRIRRLEVFGSAARGTDFNPEISDADFLVEFDPDSKDGLESYFAFKAELEALLQREVDLVEPATLRNPFLLAGVNSSRELVYAA
jgi:predicted nucleotidyltransferase